MAPLSRLGSLRDAPRWTQKGGAPFLAKHESCFFIIIFYFFIFLIFFIYFYFFTERCEHARAQTDALVKIVTIAGIATVQNDIRQARIEAPTTDQSFYNGHLIVRTAIGCGLRVRWGIATECRGPRARILRVHTENAYESGCRWGRLVSQFDIGFPLDEAARYGR